MTKLYISPSSQQSNSYATGGNEETYMNQVADILCPELTRHGIEYMRNKTTNIYVGHIEESNAYNPDYHIAIHTNAGGTTARGCTMYCYKPEERPDSPGTKMAYSIYNQLVLITPTDDRGVQDGSQILSEISKTNAPAVLMEIDFHDKPDGSNWIKSHIPEIAQAILIGILNQLGIAFIPPEPPVDYKALYEEQLAINADLQAQLDAEKAKTQQAIDDLNNMTNKYNEVVADMSAIDGAYASMDNAENQIVMAENTIANILDKY
jgi:N-acetylmuramoyl-L-alanine amidase